MIELNKACIEVFPIIIPEPSSLKSVNFYLVKQDQSLSLIDAGRNNESCWNGLTDGLKRYGFMIKDITEILLTHHHIDHVGLVDRITSTHPIPIYCHKDSIARLKRDKDFLEMRVDFYSKLYREMGCGEKGENHASYLKKAIEQNKQYTIEADLIPIEDEQVGNFQIVEIPGHSPDQIAFYYEKQNWLFSGDLLIEHISSNALVEPDPNGDRLPTLSQQIASLKKCLDLHTDVVFSGHGSLIENPNSLLLKRLERIEKKAERIIHFIQSGCMTASAIAEAYYKNTYYEQFSLVMSEIIGQLDYLESQGAIVKELVSGVWHYSVNSSIAKAEAAKF
ncbi:MBL fold metallo-hydrolase [Bacillus salipaludis]|uniref:MBL fold metallo-hydrolase n=1 Tax=Bacillus salipaludis TaxID=2547811 RepID=UPI003D2603E3